MGESEARLNYEYKAQQKKRSQGFKDLFLERKARREPRHYRARASPMQPGKGAFKATVEGEEFTRNKKGDRLSCLEGPAKCAQDPEHRTLELLGETVHTELRTEHKVASAEPTPKKQIRRLLLKGE